MERSQKIEEALSVIWEEREKKITGRPSVGNSILEKVKEAMLGDLEKDGYVAQGGDSVKLTPVGEAKAKDIIRRQRLAERLLIDVLELGRREMDTSACAIEHILSKEVEESICTLLGHPKECPHGHPIPSGECCAKAKGLLESIVVPLSKLSPGETGKVVYILTAKHPQIHKLMSFGIVPGVSITVHQIFPSYVIKVEETQVALEKEIADEIHVKRMRQ
jgi:DtxR family Mn-dependent transcriptional regulator